MQDVRSGRRQGTDPELRRLREDLYRPSPPADAVERYTALLAAQPEAPAPVAQDRVEAGRPAPVGGRRRRRAVLPIALAGAALLVAGAAAATVRPPVRDATQAEVLTPGGATAVTDGDVLASLLDPRGVDSRLVVRAVQGSELPQLDVWDVREPGVWLQEGRGDLSRRFDGRRQPSATAQPSSIIVRCAGSGAYRWTILGTTPERPAVHVLGTAGAACGSTTTVGTFTRPAGTVVRGFDLAIGRGTRWAMGFVYALDRS